jgi:aryl-alcohol dehydrogenase-like predicted oxidoreductase
MADAPDRIALAPGLDIPRIVSGLWQVADMEREGKLLDREAASTAMLEYARAGFDAFDMADHYGSAELIARRFLARVAAVNPPARIGPPPSPNGVRRPAR